MWSANRLDVWLQTVMTLKYIIKGYPLQTLYFGIANVIANGLVMLRCESETPFFQTSLCIHGPTANRVSRSI